jgi:primosomal protein N' (replication factor Y)
LTTLDYLINPGATTVAVGARVLVPVGSRRCLAVVTEMLADSPHRERLKEVAVVLDAEPVLDEDLLHLVRWMADYYLAPLGVALASALPGALRIETERRVMLSGPADLENLKTPEASLLRLLGEQGALRMSVLRRQLGPGVERTLARLRRSGAVRVVEEVKREAAPTKHTLLYEAVGVPPPADNLLAKRPALRQLYDYIRNHPLGQACASELRVTFPGAAAKLRTLMDLGLIRRREQETYRSVLPLMTEPDRAVTPTPAQQDAVEAICSALGNGFDAFLLRGVTGSGKTEVYLRAVAAALQSGHSALILVPEISLTHQLVDRIRARFGEQVAVLHSQLSAGERWDEWRRIARAEVSIVVGARSAVFAPLRRLGLIVVDEEHDPSYKQGEGVRYHGRDVAVMRAKIAGCPVVLGSATPSIESYYNAKTGRYRLLELPDRAALRPLPSVEIIDLRGSATDGIVMFSPQLIAALRANLAAGGQSLVFLNRRGFASFLQCRACGEPVMCPNCSVSLTWHRKWRALRCHYCDHTIAAPSQCSTCAEPALEMWGLGTERLESALAEALPGARVARMDRDSTRRKGSQLALLRAWASGKIDVLVGTQMVTKGHDVEGVTLVGVVFADLSMNFPDFRAAERTFQQLAQVAGRAGRGDRKGRVLIQTLQPDHYVLRAAATHDFLAFAEREINTRRDLRYPPFSRLVMTRVEGRDLGATETVAREVASRLRDLSGGRFAVLGPAPAPIERLRQRHRWQVLVRGRRGSAPRAAVARAIEDVHSLARARSVHVIPDVDPYAML